MMRNDHTPQREDEDMRWQQDDHMRWKAKGWIDHSKDADETKSWWTSDMDWQEYNGGGHPCDALDSDDEPDWVINRTASSKAAPKKSNRN